MKPYSKMTKEELEAELLEEELSEADPELEALEEAELDDIEAEESKEGKRIRSRGNSF